MPLVRVSMLEGRTVDQKRQIVEEITQTICNVCGVSAEGVDVMIEELSRDNWSHGGVLYSERGAKKPSSST
jgi:4-oxalocrotonate tautomerase